MTKNGSNENIDIDRIKKDFIQSFEKQTSSISQDILNILDSQEQEIIKTKKAKQQAIDDLNNTEEKYKKAVEFKENEYKDLIKELFEKPSQESYVLTIRTAIISIVASAAISLILTFWSNKTSSDNLISILDNYQIENIQVNEIRDYIIYLQQNEESFINLDTKHNLSLLDKMRLVDQFPDYKNEVILKGIRAAIHKKAEDIELADLKKWEREILNLYNTLYNKTIDLQKENKKTVSETFTKLNTYKSVSDETEYSGWYLDVELYLGEEDKGLITNWDIYALEQNLNDLINPIKNRLETPTQPSLKKE